MSSNIPNIDKKIENLRALMWRGSKEELFFESLLDIISEMVGAIHEAEDNLEFFRKKLKKMKKVERGVK